MRIGVICEGVTDFPVIRNILYAFFREDQIDLLQRLPDIPVNYSHAQPNNISGGWREIPKFLFNAEFRQSVSLFDYLIVQIDTDVCELAGFDVVPQSMADHDIAGFYERIKAKLAEWIDQGEPNFFAKHQHKLIFCISVHSLEYWLLIHQYPHCVGQKHDCFNVFNANSG